MRRTSMVALLIGVAGLGGTSLALRGAEQPRPAPAAVEGQPAATVPAPAHSFRARDVLGMEVRDTNGDAVGAVDDLVIDGRTGQVLYAVLAYSALDNRDQLVIMPWTILQTHYGPRKGDRYVVMDVEQPRLLKAPVVTRTAWPDVIYSEWQTWQPRIDGYYKVEVERKQKKGKEKIEIERKFKRD